MFLLLATTFNALPELIYAEKSEYAVEHEELNEVVDAFVESLFIVDGAHVEEGAHDLFFRVCCFEIQVSFQLVRPQTQLGVAVVGKPLLFEE